MSEDGDILARVNGEKQYVALSWDTTKAGIANAIPDLAQGISMWHIYPTPYPMPP